MKKCIILLTIIATLCITSCKSNEEKANELIRAELFKTLYDFNSYEPIETSIIPAKNIAINDSMCCARALILYFLNIDMLERFSKALNAAEQAEIWGPPSYWSSSFSDRKYYQYRNEVRTHIKALKISAANYNKHIDTLKNLRFNLDTTMIIGWEVMHRYRCKTKGGDSEIVNSKYIIESDFSKIIRYTDLDSEEYQAITGIFNNIDKGIAIDEKALSNL
uniref:hypothetical protein n=1 Tax=Alistipes sp. TaxID=1872444 RepID=UPI0040560950